MILECQSRAIAALAFHVEFPTWECNPRTIEAIALPPNRNGGDRFSSLPGYRATRKVPNPEDEVKNRNREVG